MNNFASWVMENTSKQPMFISDNNGFDWQFINWYFHHFLGRNPFGHSSSNLGTLYKGLVKDTSLNFKHLRKTIHTHNPVDDVLGNSEALLIIDRAIWFKSRFRMNETPANTACTRLVGVAAFSGSLRGLKLVPSKWRCLVPPTSG